MIIRSSQAARLLKSASQSSAIPDFLIPAYASRSAKLPTVTSTPASSRLFSATPANHSRLGRYPVRVPAEVTLKILGPAPRKINDSFRVEPDAIVEVEGPLGKNSFPVPPFVTINYDEATRQATVSIESRLIRKQREMWGTIRSHLINHIAGVSEGHSAVLRMVGVGFRATLESTATTIAPTYEGQQFLSLKCGFPHVVELGIPKGMKASVPQPTRILLEGTVKAAVNQFAATIRSWRKPEPYKGKGIFVNGETIRLKPKKIK